MIDIDKIRLKVDPRVLQIVLVYAVVALIVMGPMLKPGFVLTLDMVFTPKLAGPTHGGSAYLLQWFLHVVNFVVPGEVVEKVVIFGILLVSGVGMHRLVRTEAQLPRYFAGIFYMINPFTYERWMAGQYLVLAGYVVLPFLVRSLIGFCRRPGPQAALKLSLWYTLVVLLSVHVFVMAGLLGVVMLVVYLLGQSPTGKYYRNLLEAAGLVIGGFIVLNIYWLFSVAQGSSSLNQTIESIGSRDLSAFATAGNAHLHLLFNVVSLYGFWLERFKRYAMPNHILAIWIIGFVCFAGLVVMGARELKRQRALPASALAVTAVIGLVMALGPEAAVTGGLVRGIINHVPLMKGFREPEKFSALLVLLYAYFAAYGLDALQRRIPAHAEGRRELVRDAALLLPALYVSTMPFGFANQLKPVSYPASWYTYEKQLKAHPVSGKLLFLPWHEYMSYDFAPRIIANPAPHFFTAQVIAGTNAQFGGANDPDPTPAGLFIENTILAHTHQTNLGAQLNKLQVHYVLLANGYDVDQYRWLARQTDLKLIFNQPGLSVFQNEAYHD
jgi:hypothetical protein